MFGVPVTRSRKYCLMKERGCLEWVHQVEKDPTTAFHVLFGRPVGIDGRIFYCAPEEMVAETHQAIARQKNMTETQANGSAWPMKLLMSTGTRERVRHWEEFLGFGQVIFFLKGSMCRQIILFQTCFGEKQFSFASLSLSPGSAASSHSWEGIRPASLS